MEQCRLLWNSQIFVRRGGLAVGVSSRATKVGEAGDTENNFDGKARLVPCRIAAAALNIAYLLCPRLRCDLTSQRRMRWNIAILTHNQAVGKRQGSLGRNCGDRLHSIRGDGGERLPGTHASNMVGAIFGKTYTIHHEVR